jgi:alpha-L-fucosidase
MNNAKLLTTLLLAIIILSCAPKTPPPQLLTETKEQHDARMQWWRDARFGLFIHWGLYAVPAGEWKGETSHAEWIRETAQIPIAEYEKFVPQFNPVKFDANAWVRMAKEAGMKYIVITSKHHDGFCLFDSKETDFDVMSTPFKRDIMKELSEACAKEGIKMCWYHSIMDWHHPDYLPRRTWEQKDRPADGANYDRYVEYLKAELKELTTNYGPIGVLWFDGEWEQTWTEGRGRDLYAYVRSLQPNIIINNRVGAARSGMGGFTPEGAFAGDFGTPEQQIPATGLAGVDWETCMTMNDHWGYNKNDHNWKSSKELLQNLADIASKGGNFLLNIGPTAEGVFPSESIERLHDIGEWMKVNGEAIYGTQASPFRTLAWGRCTQKDGNAETRLYLHVFDWPRDGKLIVPGLLNDPENAYLLSDASRSTIKAVKTGANVAIELPKQAPDAINSVVVLDIKGTPSVVQAPEFTRASKGDGLEITLATAVKDPDYKVRFTTDGSVPTTKSAEMKEPVKLQFPSAFKAAAFYKDAQFGDITTMDIPLSVGKSVKLTTLPSDKYKGDGPQTLTDGIFGSNEYSDGKWLGFEQNDFDAVVDLGQSTKIKSIALNYLAASAAWIFAPVEITYAVSEDGKTFRTVGNVKKDPKNWKVERGASRFSKDLSGVKARYVKVVAKNMGMCPDDHAGKGGKAWLFVDEISIR